MERKRTYRMLATGLVLTLCIAVAAAAMQSQQNQSSQGQPDQQWSQPQQQQRSQQQQMQGRNGENGQNGELTADPAGWVRIAYDYDEDGYVDAYEYIFAYDLERAKQQSAQRQGAPGRQMSNGGQSRQMQDRQMQGRQMQGQTGRQGVSNYVQGQISSLQVRTVNNQERLVARVRTQDNRTVPVILGNPDRLGRLDLQQGDSIRVVGQRTQFGQLSALKAREIRANNQRVMIRSRGDAMQGRTQQNQFNGSAEWQFDQQGRQQQMQQGRGQQMQRGGQSMMQGGGQMRQQQARMVQTSGTIEDVRQVKLSGQDQNHLVAAISTDAGQTRIVDLGPRNQLRNLQLETGDQIQVIGTRGTINSKQVLMADQVRSNGQSARIRRTRNRNDFRLKGEVVRTTNRTLPGDDRAHTIALVETIQGSRYPVDLGPRQQLSRKDINISEGQDITLIVQPGRAGDKRILEARKISFDDQVFQRNL